MFYKGNPKKKAAARIWAESEDVHVRKYIVYVNEDDIACFDPEGLYPIKAEDLENLYLKGFLISDDGVYYHVFSMIKDEGVIKVEYIKVVDNIPELQVISSYIPEPEPLILLELALSDIDLVPSFAEDEFTYTADTDAETSTLSFVVSPLGTPVVVKLGNTEIDIQESITWLDGENILTIELGEDGEVVYDITVTYTPAITPFESPLTGITLGSCVLDPVFDPEVVSYTTTTTETSDLLTLTLDPSETDVTVKLGNDEITDLATAIVWQEGSNILTIEFPTYTVDSVPLTYSISVTKST